MYVHTRTTVHTRIVAIIRTVKWSSDAVSVDARGPGRPRDGDDVNDKGKFNHNFF